MQLVVTKSNTLNAFSWIKQGWRLFTLQPSVFMGMAAVVLGATLLANMIPVLGIIVVFLSPFLAAGFYRAASKAEQDDALSVTDIFALLSEVGKYRVLIRLAAFSLLFSIPTTLLADEIMVSMEQGVQPEFSAMLSFVILLAVNFMAFAFAIPAAWVSPESSALQLIKQSFQACWINVVPLTIYGILMMVLTLVSAPIILIGWLIAYAVGVLSFYQMFMSIYQPINAQPTQVVDDEQHDEEQNSKDL